MPRFSAGKPSAAFQTVRSCESDSASMWPWSGEGGGCQPLPCSPRLVSRRCHARFLEQDGLRTGRHRCKCRKARPYRGNWLIVLLHAVGHRVRLTWPSEIAMSGIPPKADITQRDCQSALGQKQTSSAARTSLQKPSQPTMRPELLAATLSTQL
jgi:hypothetical protein